MWRRHRRTFWIVHSVWALATGVAVLVLSHERYGFVPWVVAFLGLTWASTLFFSGSGNAGDDEKARLRIGFTSYATRVLYQETLFFLLPFYAYSTVFPSWNVLFLVLLAGLAMLACLDLVFDRWLRQSPAFGMLFFALVAFAALNLLLPMILGLDPRLATRLSAVLAVASAVPLALRGGVGSLAGRLRLGGAGIAILVVAFLGSEFVPPVPLRLEKLRFGTGFDSVSFELEGELDRPAKEGTFTDTLVAVAEVFAPSNVSARVALEWSRDGKIVRTSRDVRIVAHRGGFRVWDAYREEHGLLEEGRYRVVLKTSEGRLFGAAGIQLP